MKRYIRSNMLGPAFNLGGDDCEYVIVGCVYNEDEAVFEMVDHLQSCVSDIEQAVDVIIDYLQDYSVESVFVNGKVEFDASDYWTRSEVLSKLLDEC